MRLKTKNRLIYFLPIIGRIRLVKRMEKLERRLEEANGTMGVPLVEFYESRIQRIYDKILWLIDNKEIGL